MSEKPAGKLSLVVLLLSLAVVVFLGLMVRLVVKVGEMDIIVDFLEKRFEDMGINRGDAIDLYFPPDGFTIYKKD